MRNTRSSVIILMYVKHEMVHLKPSIECYGCCRMFTTYPAMILHLEAGTCTSNIDIIDLNESAAKCY